jgi:tetratricopeptide (TPR) repeat protein
MRGTALLQRAYACRLRHRDIMSIAQQILPSYEEMFQLLSILLANANVEFSQRTALDFLNRLAVLYHTNFEGMSKWNDIKGRWPEAREGPVVQNGDELINRATFSWALYEHALLRATQDLLTATVLLPGFAQAWRRAGDALSEIRLYHAAMEYYEVAVQLDSSLSESLLPGIERMKLIDKLMTNAEFKGLSAETILALIED